MSTYSNPLTEFSMQWESGPDPEFGQGSASGVFNEQDEMELAAELLDVSNEQELDQFLGDLIRKAGSAIGSVVNSPIGKAVGGALKAAAGKVLPIAGVRWGLLRGTAGRQDRQAASPVWPGRRWASNSKDSARKTRSSKPVSSLSDLRGNCAPGAAIAARFRSGAGRGRRRGTGRPRTRTGAGRPWPGRRAAVRPAERQMDSPARKNCFARSLSQSVPYRRGTPRDRGPSRASRSRSQNLSRN